MNDFPAGWLVAAAVAIGDGTAEPEHLEAARRALHALRREGALRRLAEPNPEVDGALLRHRLGPEGP